MRRACWREWSTCALPCCRRPLPGGSSSPSGSTPEVLDVPGAGAVLRLLLVNGFAVGCISLDRVTDLRPRGFPAATGLAVEHAAHRIAVEWNQGAVAATGFFVVARHSSSRFDRRCRRSSLPGAPRAGDVCRLRPSPGAQGRVRESRRQERRGRLCRRRRLTSAAAQLFASTDDARRFFRRGAVSYSLRRHGGVARRARRCAPDVAHRAGAGGSDRACVDTSRLPTGHRDPRLGLPDARHVPVEMARRSRLPVEQGVWLAQGPGKVARSWSSSAASPSTAGVCAGSRRP